MKRIYRKGSKPSRRRSLAAKRVRVAAGLTQKQLAATLGQTLTYLRSQEWGQRALSVSYEQWLKAEKARRKAAVSCGEQ